MADDNKILIEIVLDDGSVQKGFLKVKNEGEKAAAGLESSFSRAFKVDGLADLNAGLMLVGETAKIIGKALKGAFDLALEGEALKKIDKQFEALAAQAGLPGEKLKAGLEAAAGGLVDNSELLKLANEQLVRLGVNSERLPEVFELARKASSVFGGTALERFEQISQAIATGQSRQLKSLGLNADLEESQNKFAKSLGLTSAELSEQQQQFVRLNAVLEAGNKRFGEIELTNNSLLATYQKLQSQLKDAGDNFALFINKSLGPDLQQSLGSAAAFVDRLNISFKETFLGVAPNSREQLKLLQNQLEEVSRFRNAGRVSVGPDPIKIAELRSQIDLLTASIKEEDEALRREIGTGKLSVAELEARKLKLEQLNQARNRSLQDENKLLGFQQQQFQTRIALDQQELQQATDQQEQLLALEQLTQDQLIALGAEADLKRNAIDLAYNDAKFSEKQTQDQLLINQEIATENQRTLIMQNAANERAKILNDEGQRWKVAQTQISQTIKNGMVAAISGGTQTLVTSLMKGQDALSAFGKFILSTFGDMSIQIGQIMISAALGMIALKGLDPTGLLIAGVGLVALGTLLKGIGGGGATESAGSGSFGGVQDTFNPNTGPLAQVEEQQRVANTDVQVVVNGDIFDSDATGSRIVDLINSAFDKQGVTVRQGFA